MTGVLVCLSLGQIADSTRPPRQENTIIKRYHAFEFGDQPWLSSTIREGYHDCLSFVHRLYQPYYHFARFIADWAKSENATQILDIGSGSGEQIAAVVQTLKSMGIDTPSPQFVVSDLYPDVKAYALLSERFGENAVSFLPNPVSALAIEGTNIRCWTIFTAFHHFSPENARKLLEQLVAKGDSLLIIEMTQRSLFQLFLILSGMPYHIFAPFFARQFRFRKLLFTSIIPIIPLLVAFDGVVSGLRTYRKEEVSSLMPPDQLDAFQIEYKEVRWRYMPLCKSTMVMIKRKR